MAQTSQVSVEILQPPDLSHQPPPQGLLQVLPLAAALHQRLIGLRNPLNLLLQLDRGKKRPREGGGRVRFGGAMKQEFSVNLLHMPGRSCNVYSCRFSTGIPESSCPI